MIKYEIDIRQKSTNRFLPVITANGKKFIVGQVWHTYDKARLDGNNLLSQVEHLNGDWNGDHKNATYHYLNSAKQKVYCWSSLAHRTTLEHELLEIA